MICPICGLEMKEGYIPASSIEWIPKDNQPQIFYKKDKSDGFRIGKHSFGNMKKQPAWYCLNCDRITIDCKLSAEKF